MKLDPDCVRDIMTYIEENHDYGNCLMFMWGMDIVIKNYSEDEVLNTVEYLVAKSYLRDNGIDNGYLITGILPDGYEFLANTRKSSVWDETKTTLKEKGVEGAIDIMGKVAKKIVEKKLGIDLS